MFGKGSTSIHPLPPLKSIFHKTRLTEPRPLFPASITTSHRDKSHKLLGNDHARTEPLVIDALPLEEKPHALTGVRNALTPLRVGLLAPFPWDDDTLHSRPSRTIT